MTNLTQADLEGALQGGGSVLFGVSGTLSLTNTITIAQDTTLDANGNAVVISGSSSVRLFQLTTNVQFWVKALTLADGAVVGTNAPDLDTSLPGGDAMGAGILNQGGTLILTGCTLTNHSVRGGSASSGTSGGTGNGGRALGAAICSFAGTVNMTNCTAIQATAQGGDASPYPTSLTYSGPGWGGAIYSERSTLNLVNVILASNRAAGGAQGSTTAGAAGRLGDGAGGALFVTNSRVLLTGCTLQKNSVTGGGAMLVNSYPGGGCGDGMGGALFITEDCSGQVQLCAFTSNSVAGGNGNHNLACGRAQGGSIFNEGQLQLSSCSVMSNRCTGGSYAYTGGVGQGGGLFSSGILAMAGCCFVGNLATGGSPGSFGTGGDGEGGAIWISNALNATNSTFTADRALGANSSGGAILVTNGTASLVNVTIALNGTYLTNVSGISSDSLGGGLYTTNAQVTVRNSIIGNNTNGGDVWGSILDGDYNICSDGTAHFTAKGSLNNADPMLAALSQNGGPTPTMSLLAGSPARDVIPSGFPPVDQRGVSRPQGPAADIGAFEADFISSAPAIVSQPVGGTVRAGTNVTLTVGASGTAPLAYQWLKDGIALSGAIEASLLLSNVQAVDAATYTAVVTNAFGTAISQGAVLVVDSKPLILIQPMGTVIMPGGSAQFSVSADGPSLAYQWWHGTAPVPGAALPVLTISNAMAGAQGDYFAVVTNFAGAVTSAPAVLSFDSSALSILVPPKDQTVEAGYATSFSVLVSGIPPFAYQWQHNGVSIPGATDSSLTFAATTNDAGSYSVTVTNGYSLLTSASALLTVTPGATPPVLVPGRVGQSLTVTFTGQAGRSYRLLGSTNLVSWTSLATNTALLSGPLQFVQPIEPVRGAFFRVVTP